MNKYRVQVKVEIQRVDENGWMTNERLSFEDVTELGSLNFTQIADLLMRFHSLSETAVEELTSSDATVEATD